MTVGARSRNAGGGVWARLSGPVPAAVWVPIGECGPGPLAAWLQLCAGPCRPSRAVTATMGAPEGQDGVWQSTGSWR